MKWSSPILIITLLLVTLSCDRSPQIFRKLPAKKTGIYFNNKLEEDEEHNVYRFMNFYTGAGVAAGDVNNDGLTDLYFSGNMASGRLYLNKGGLQFEDITESAGLQNDRWGTGCTMVDINQDGWLDIYLTVSGSGEKESLENMLFINNKDNTFDEQAAAFGIADKRQTQHSAFFDYDLDGDLDLFLIINPAAYEQKVNVVTPRKLNGEAISTDVLYRNDGNGHFSDVSREAGILVEGYSLGVGISDIDNDGWPDIYISNDFVGNDVLYVNNGDGTFNDKAAGNDIADFNNDGLMDIMVLDMRPEDNLRQKLIISSTSYDLFQLMLETGYMPQYSRNTLQLNRGDGYFSEVGFMSGVSSTDWSWSALFADYDNDGDKDLFVTNGFLRDLGNLDYIHYQNIYDNPIGEPEAKIKNKLDNIKELDGADLKDYLYENTGNLKFRKRSGDWGIKHSGYSNGAVYADLDNDGDLELVVNNINESAHLYENLSDAKTSHNFLQLKLNGPKQNLQGIGARIELYQGDRIQVYEHFTSRGYESSVDPKPHFGLGSDPVDSIRIRWPDGRHQKLNKVLPNQVLELNYKDAKAYNPPSSSSPLAIFNPPEDQPLDFIHRENQQVDFKIQPILPHMHAQLGPGIAVGDINGDLLEDVYIGGARGQSGRFSLQHPDSIDFVNQVWSEDSLFEDMGCLFFDVEQDGDLDLYVVSGGTSYPEGSGFYQDRLYINDGRGIFSKYMEPMPAASSGSCVVGADFDKDGDIDLFIGGRIKPGNYPLSPKSYLLRNDTPVNGSPQFTDITNTIEGLEEIGMVTAALWTDYNNDTWMDLMVTGEFMPVKVFGNNNGMLEAKNPQGLQDSEGWWNSIAGGDFDHDGDIDYFLGNLGLNSRYQASVAEPLCIYASDYDKNGRIDPVLCYFIEGENYIAHSRDEIIQQISAMRARFKTYQEYAEATFKQSFLPSELESAYIVQSKRFENSYLENTGEGTFILHKLPMEAQLAPVYGMTIDDYDQNGTLDVLLTGNSYSTEVSTGRYDSSFGLVLLGNGNGEWQPLNLQESGFRNKGDAKGMALLNYHDKRMIVVANNNAAANSFMSNRSNKVQTVRETDQHAMVYYPEGKRRKVEFYHGSGYFSQSTKSFTVDDNVLKIIVTDNKGNSRELPVSTD
jgi:hypothetical protein